MHDLLPAPELLTHVQDGSCPVQPNQDLLWMTLVQENGEIWTFDEEGLEQDAHMAFELVDNPSYRRHTAYLRPVPLMSPVAPLIPHNSVSKG